MGEFLLDLAIWIGLRMAVLAIGIFVLWAVTRGRWSFEDKDGKDPGNKRRDLALLVGALVVGAIGVAAYFAFR